MHRDSFHSFRQDIAAFDPALALQLDEALHVEPDAAEFLPARGQAGEVIAGIFVRQPARLQRTVGVLRQAYGDEPRPVNANRRKPKQPQDHDPVQQHQSPQRQPDPFRFTHHCHRKPRALKRSVPHNRMFFGLRTARRRPFQ